MSDPSPSLELPASEIRLSKARVVVALLGPARSVVERICSLLAAGGLRFEVRLGELERHWASFTTVARSGTLLPPRQSQVPDVPLGADETPGCLLFEAPHSPALARVALGLIREDSKLSSLKALLAVAAGQVHAFKPEWGFDDFIVHPYNPEELHRRLAKLQEPAVSAALPTVANVSVNLAAHEVLVSGKPVALTHREFELLRCLLANGGHVLSRQQLLSQVWGHDYDGGRRTVDTHVRRLRSKLGSGFPLATVRGTGYRLTCGAEKLLA